MEIDEIELKVLDMMELDEDQGENDNEFMMYEETMEKCEVPESMEGISHIDNNTMTSVTRDEEQFMAERGKVMRRSASIFSFL